MVQHTDTPQLPAPSSLTVSLFAGKPDDLKSSLKNTLGFKDLSFQSSGNLMAAPSRERFAFPPVDKPADNSWGRNLLGRVLAPEFATAIEAFLEKNKGGMELAPHVKLSITGGGAELKSGDYYVHASAKKVTLGIQGKFR